MRQNKKKSIIHVHRLAPLFPTRLGSIEWYVYIIQQFQLNSSVISFGLFLLFPLFRISLNATIYVEGDMLVK